MIGKNIAKYRKAKNMTQAELGLCLGLSNQAVSKWENEISLPDVYLLPKIAAALDITLEQLYGLPQAAEECADADAFPAAAEDLLLRFFYRCANVRFTCDDPTDAAQLAYWRTSLENGNLFGCYSNTRGGVVLSDGISLIDTTFKLPGSEEIFADGYIGKVLHHLSDKTVRAVLAFEYRIFFDRCRGRSCIDSDRLFYVKDIAGGCDISPLETEDALEKLILLELNEATDDGAGKRAYEFRVGNALFALAICKLAKCMTDDKVWQVLRDSTLISDYAFRD